MRSRLIICSALLLAACGGGTDSLAPSTGGPRAGWQAVDSGWVYVAGDRRFEIEAEPLRYRLILADRERLVQRAASADGIVRNRDYAGCNDRENGIDKCYPGFPTASYQPLAYTVDADAARWEHATAIVTQAPDANDGMRFTLATTDGEGATLQVTPGADGAFELVYQPHAANVVAVSDSWVAGRGEQYFGGGQRFERFALRGRSIPLWISHGPGASRGLLTNETAAPFVWSTAGWGLWGAQDQRGELDLAQTGEMADALRIMREATALSLVIYVDTPRKLLASHTARAGRPQWTPPDWAWMPMVWRDNDNDTASTLSLVNGMLERDIPLGAVWLDNPWDAGKGSFDFDPQRYADPDALIDRLAALDVRLMVWLSPFMTGPQADDAASRGWLVEGTRPDGLDATYHPVRGIDPHLDFTHPDAVNAWILGLEGLVARGVAGAKLDRCEEDLSDDSVWFNGRHNRENHNAYCVAYQRAVFEAFRRQRGDDFLAVSRGGWTGSPRYTAHWDADRSSGPGVLGLRQALNGLLSMSASGFPFYGPDIGGYAGLRQDIGEDAANIPLLIPTPGTYIRWAQLGALSPIMQTPIPPWWVNETAVQVYRRFATLHTRLVPYIAAAAARAIDEGVPIVQPMPLAYPDDPRAVANEDQYLFGSDLLVAPVVDLTTEASLGLLPTPRTIYLPTGDWRDFWSGETLRGPRTVTRLVPIDEMPIFVRAGAILPDGVSAAALP